MNKDIARHYRRTKKTRGKIRELQMPRLSVHRSLNNIYAQVFTFDGAKVLVSASTLEKDFAKKTKKACASNIASATLIGEMIAKRATEKGIKEVAFDRSGFKYHGCVKALAEAARANGLIF